VEVSLLAGSRLDESLVRKWRELQAGNPDLASPYFSPEFTQAVAAVRDDVEVTVVREAGEITAFFPFQRSPGSIGVPVGGILSDYQGLICRPGCTCDPRELVRKCNLVTWDFDHLLVSQASFARYHRACEPSPQIDLSKGYAAYAAARRAAGSEQIKKCGNLARRLEREIGPVRFVAHSADSQLLERTLAWKSQQYRQSGQDDLFALGWPRALVKRVHATQTEGFAGMLSLLLAGERLVAGHFGMRSQTVWHYWFPAYDPEMAKYSPGLILLLKMAEHAPEIGIGTIDLGKGISLYKERLMNGSAAVASGSVELASLLALRRRAKRTLRAAIARSPLAGPARTVTRWTRRPN
jgi:CelD/BcsL family acetyltransferase involved in cellulose biosynthesis